ncbi:hypothetical protein Esi_0176_0004 [Ectocarpus siliculosus]|uniref:Uncharacterized protein n=1 Tax=Ectocarpus siliculosus TaxID=2880 RepID=D8LGP9_ECTSI|nr:hypothetical protein Esi_0176_0004 [Ectocarpus siliculosus]|eukprot:CBN79069.1 hypothetical protein Esi_0176_0004 [Ectocarpus siliculosus]
MQIVVQAHGSNLFGLVKREFRHVFKVGELERSSSTHTSFLLRSVKHLSKGNEKMKKEILERSLSLVHKNEAVDMTFASKAECDQLGEWIAAKWSVAMLQKSFKGNPRIAMALQGRNISMAREGAYDAPKKTGRRGRGRGGSGGGEDEVDGAGFGRLPKLDAKTKAKLEEDLLGGVHVTYHDLSLRGYISTSTPRRLRYDCQSKAGLVYLEASFEGDGDDIVEPLSSLVQVGGGLSAHGPTSSLLRATAGDNKEQRAAAVSLVFSARSMDITCGCLKDAHELVLYFSELKGFTRAKPPDRSMLGYAPDDAGRQTARESCTGVRGGGTGGHRGVSPRQQDDVHAAGAAMLNMSETDGGPPGTGIDVEDATGQSAPSYGARKMSPAETLGSSVPSFSTRFRSGYGGDDRGDGGEGSPGLLRQSSAASGFNTTASLRGLPSEGEAALHRVWKAGGGAKGSEPPRSPGSLGAGAPQFHSTPTTGRRATIAVVSPTPEARAEGGGRKGRRGEHPHALQQQGRNRGRQQQGDSRTAETPGSPAGRAAAATARAAPPPTYEALVNSGGSGGNVAAAAAASAGFTPSHDEGSSSQHQHQQPRPGRTVGTLARRNASRTPPRRGGEGQQHQQQQADPTAARREERSPTPTSRGRGRRDTLGVAPGGGDGGSGGGGGARSPARGGTARPLPPTPDDIAWGAGAGAADAADHRVRHRANLQAQFPGSGGGGGGGGARGSGSGRSPPPPPPRPGTAGAAARPFTNPADVAASVREAEHNADVIKTMAGGLGAAAGGRDRGGGSGSGSLGGGGGGGGETVVERRRFGGIERRTVETRAGGSGTRSPTRSASPADHRGGGGRGGGSIEDDDSFTTFRVKGPTPAPEPIDDIDRSGSGAYGRRRSPTGSSLDHSGTGARRSPAGSSLDHSWTGARRSPAGSDASASGRGGGHSASPTRAKLRLRKTGIGKAFREGAKLFSSGGGVVPSRSHGKTSGSPVSRSPSPAGARGGSRGLGSLDLSSNGGGGGGGGGGIRNRFFSNPRARTGGGKPAYASAGIGGVEDFSATAAAAKYSKFSTSPAAAATQASATSTQARRESHS